MHNFIRGMDAGEKMARAQKLLEDAQEYRWHVSLGRVDPSAESVELIVHAGDRIQIMQVSYFDLYELRIHLPCAEVSPQKFALARDAIRVVRFRLADIASHPRFFAHPESRICRLHITLMRRAVRFTTALFARLSR